MFKKREKSVGFTSDSDTCSENDSDNPFTEYIELRKKTLKAQASMAAHTNVETARDSHASSTP